VLAQLSSYLDGELTQPERAQIEQHLIGCSVCERFGGRFANTVHDLRGALGADLAVDLALVERLRARLAQE
jgi:anti-sigma factor RsiW